jgi:5-methylcytosine-specific restriction endonuclease McrBC regulatory subunit McrC
VAKTSRDLLVGYEQTPLDASGLTSDQRRRLLRDSKSVAPDLITVARNGDLRLGGYVGFVDLGWVQLEILAKASTGSPLRDDRAFLQRLLSEAGLVPRAILQDASTGFSDSPLLETLAGVFAERLHLGLVRGPPRRYECVQALTPSPRGKIDLGQYARMLPPDRRFVPVTHFPLHRDNPLTRLLLSVVTELSSVTRSPSTRALLLRCTELFGEVVLLDIRDACRVPPGLSRYEEEWRPFVDLALLLAQNKAPSAVQAGPHEAFSLIFSLDDVFERLLRTRLSVNPPMGLFLSRRTERKLLLHPLPTGRPSMRLRPDFLFRGDDGAPSVIADAKWKVLSERGPSHGLKPPDIYQINTYLAAYQLSDGVLLFPKARWMPGGGKPWTRQFRLLGGSTRLIVAAVDVHGLVSTDKSVRQKALEGLHALFQAIDVQEEVAVQTEGSLTA